MLFILIDPPISWQKRWNTAVIPIEMLYFLKKWTDLFPVNYTSKNVYMFIVAVSGKKNNTINSERL